MDCPIKSISPSEVQVMIKTLNNTKYPGYDFISPKMIKLLPKKGVIFLTIIFNAILRLNVILRL